ncbi:DUF2628 domain-containing protein [Clostridium sp. E02]|uniref:DUF2628 domain-containing protein n=1 Tax=Clostridium sp. E02 TaxID=2487134 RepID=UPI000F52F05F|nr:DUF2628 domain-containing protein [Clostridium sp. E02]
MENEYEILNSWGAELFVGENSDYYKNKWGNIRTDQKFESWNIAAVFFPVYWLVYRKMYLEAFLCFIASLVLSIIPLGFLVPHIVIGMFGNSIYRKKALTVIRRTSGMTTEEAKRYIKKQGGTNFLAIIIIIATILLIILGIFGVVFVSSMMDHIPTEQTKSSIVRLADEETYEVTTKDGLITLTVPNDFIEDYSENLDLSCTSSSRNLDLVVLVYRKEDLAESTAEEDLINLIASNIKESELTLLPDGELPQLNDNVIQKLYYSEDNGIKNNWYIACRKVGDNYVVIVSSFLPSIWHEFRELYGDIVLSARPAIKMQEGGDA